MTTPQTATISGTRYDTGAHVRLAIAEGAVTSVEETAAGPAAAITESQTMLAPALVDLQINGILGQEFVAEGLRPDEAHAMGRAVQSTGVARFCPTITTLSIDRLCRSAATIAEAIDRDEDFARAVAGIHLEGPFISPETGPRGAHPQPFCRPPDWETFQTIQQAAGGWIRLVTLSPEFDGSPAMIARLVKSGVKVAIGHTAANSDQIAAAVDAGASMSTHLGNGAHALIRRHPNYIWDQLADDRLLASLIVDGHHLPASVVRCFVRAKGPQRCLLVSDLTGMGGLPPGRYQSAALGDVEVLEDGKLVVAGQRDYLAGAARPLFDALPRVTRDAGLPLRDAIHMATTGPAQFIGCRVGGFQVGDPADLIEITIEPSAQGDRRWRLKRIWIGGVALEPHVSVA